MNLQKLAQLSEQEKIERIITLEARIAELETQANAHEDLKQRETQFRTLAENSPDLIARVDREFTYIYVNKAFAESFKMSQKQIIGVKTNAVPAHPETIARWQEIRQRVFATGQTLKYELEHKDAERQEGQIYYETYVVPEFDEDGIVQSVLSITRNITELKLTQQALEANQSNLRALIENIQDSVWSVDQNYNLIVVNENMIDIYYKFFGINLEVGMNIFDAVDDDDYRNHWQGEYDRALRGEYFHREFTFGDTIYKISFSPIFAKSGHTEGVIVFASDITEQKQGEQQLKFQADVLENIQDAVVGIDNNYCTTYLNRAALELYGLDPIDSLGKPLSKLYGYEWYDEEDLPRAMRDLEENGFSFTTLRHKKQDGKFIDVEATTTLLRDANGEQSGFLAVIRDVTERRKIEQLYRALVNQSLVGFGVIAKDGTYIYVSPEMENLTGYSTTELLAMNSEQAMNLIPPEYRAIMNVNRENRLEGKHAPSNYETQLIRKDGEHIWLELNITVGDYDGESVVYAAGLDVTARKLAQEQLKEQEALYRLMAENTTDIVTLTNAEGIVTYASPSVTPELGYAPEDRVGKTIMDAIHPDDLQNLFSERDSYIQTNSGLIEYRLRHNEGHYLWMETSIRVLRTEDGSVDTIIGITRNIEDRKQAEIRLRESQHYIQRITDAAPYIIYVHDYEKQHDVFINQFGARFFDISQDEPFRITPEVIAKHYHPDDLDFAREQIKSLNGSTDNQVAIFDARVKNISGEWRWLNFRVVPFKFSDDGQLLQELGLCQDITERREAEERIFKLALEQEKVKFLTDFIVSASHEFRTPLSVINTSLHMIMRHNNLPDDYPYVMRIHERVDDILMLVEAITTFARLERDTPNLTMVNLRHLVKDTITYMSQKAAKRNIQLYLEEPSQEVVIEGDIQNIMLMLRKVIENAILFNVDGGEVFINVGLTDKNNHSVISVRDTGIGVPEEFQQRIFDSFFRVDSAQTERGFGLGLAVARIIVDQHHGDISVASTPGKGTTLTIQLPAKQDKS
ncbi:MAG: PAS domain S-box protein [Aggregatilineales bacterium]